MHTLTIRLPDDTAERLKALARSRGLSMSKLVEELSAKALSDIRVVLGIANFLIAWEGFVHVHASATDYYPAEVFPDTTSTGTPST